MDKPTSDEKKIEIHPLTAFLPVNAKILMLGSFPPPQKRWSIDFYYPNFNNDFWRIMGLIFMNNKEALVLPNQKKFDQASVVSFCDQKGIALSDTAQSVIRHHDNASDDSLEMVEIQNISAIIDQLPACQTLVTTGGKASEVLSSLFQTACPTIGSSTLLQGAARQIQWYRMPSSSRAYPLSIEKKTAYYQKMFRAIGML